MQHRQVIVRFFLPASQESPKAVDPRMRSLHYPSSCFESRVPLPLHFFLAARFNVRPIVAMLEKLTHLRRVVSFVETDVLMPTRGGLRPVDGNAIESGLKKLDVVRVRAADFDAQRNAASVGEHRAFRTQLTAIGGVLARIFPHPEAIWSSLRQRFANSTGCPSAHHIRASISSTTCGRRPLRSTAGSNDAVCCPSHIPETRLSTGNLFAVRKIFLEPLVSDRPAVDLLWGSLNNVAAVAGSAAKAPREVAKNYVISVLLSPLKTPPCWLTSDKLSAIRTRGLDGSVLG